MSAVGGRPVERPIEFGLCRSCNRWRRGRLVEDRTAHTAIVDHCQPSNDATTAPAAAPPQE